MYKYKSILNTILIILMTFLLMILILNTHVLYRSGQAAWDLRASAVAA